MAGVIGGMGIFAMAAALVWSVGLVLVSGRVIAARINAQIMGHGTVDWSAAIAGLVFGPVISFSFPTNLGEVCMGQQIGPFVGIKEHPALLVLQGY